jgi:hypothetical protein
MGPGISRYILGPTPAVTFPSLQLKLFDFMEGIPIEVAHSNLDPLTLIWLFFFDCELLEVSFPFLITFSFYPKKEPCI